VPPRPFQGGKQEEFVELGIRCEVHIRPKWLDAHFAVTEVPLAKQIALRQF
jgi:hypothetical protein